MAVPASAQVSVGVVETLGDATETTCVASDSRELWIGTLGAGVFRVKGGKADTSGKPERFDTMHGLGNNRVRDCVLADGQLWVATDGWLSKFDPVAQRFGAVREGRYLKVAAAGNAVVAVRADGLVERFYDGRTGAGGALLHVVAAALALSADGKRYAVGGIDGALYVDTDGALHRISLPEPPGGVREPIERLAFSGYTLSIGTSVSALEVSAALQVKTLSPPSADADPALRGLLVNGRARFGSAEVIATDAGAFMRASPGAALTKIELPGLPCGDRISALTVQGDVLWIGSFDRGLCRLDANGYTHFAGPKYLPSDMVNALASDEHTVYVATDAGLATIDAAGTFAQFTHQQCVGNLAGRCPWHAAVNGVAVDSSTGMVWVADIGALHRIDPKTGEWQHPGTRAVLGSQAVTRVAAFNGQVAIGTSDRGVLLWNGKRTRTLDDQHGLADNWVTDLAYDTRGRLWVATCTRGVSVRERDGRIRNISYGLSDQYVLSVQELDGRIWLGTLRGATLFAGERPIPLDTRHGLGGNEVHDAVFYRGNVWLATDGGLSVMVVTRLPSDDE